MKTPAVRVQIGELPNLGPKSQAMLASAGIKSVAQLRRLGAVAAYARVKRTGAKVSLNLLWAIEGALTGLSWQQVARERREVLLFALELRSEPITPSERKRQTGTSGWVQTVMACMKSGEKVMIHGPLPLWSCAVRTIKCAAVPIGELKLARSFQL